MSDIKSGVIVIDNNSIIQCADDTSKEIFGLEGDLVNKSISDLVTDTSIIKLINTVLNTRTPDSIDLRPEWDQNKIISIKIDPYSTSKENGFFIIATDLSKLKKLEGIQKEFVANVSHELRTPLTSIKMAAESLQLGAISDEKMRNKFLSNIQREADRLTRLVNELLVIASLDNKVTLHVSQFDTYELLSDVATVMKHHADLNDITLISDFPENLSKISADKDRVQQVLINLTDNAIKCNKQNGKVTLYAREDENYLEIKVIDTGIGIQKLDQERIFDRFFRVDKSRSRVTGGTGLGLSIVKDIIEAHGGSVRVESEIDVGTTFIIRLPKQAK